MNIGQLPEKDQFYVLQSDPRGGGPGTDVEIENLDALLTPPSRILRPENGGFPSLPEVPHLVHAKRSKRMPRDLEGGFSGYWLVSERLKQVFESIDSAGFEFLACDYTLPDGSNGPLHYLCDVVRMLAALDEQKSTYQVRTGHEFETGKPFRIMTFAGGARLSFKKDLVGSAHVFRMAEKKSSVICDRMLYTAIRKAGIGVKPGSGGLLWRDAADV
ncbi:imm11 family protein [Pseudomonas caspiana]|uniref:imm11 family protein n=1 Tax=Pseudomonas caspiana TaxID=1451454 RepID=UPI0032EED9B1